MVTKEILMDMGPDKLAEFLVMVQQDRPDIQREVKRLMAKFDDDPQKFFQIMKKEVAGVKRLIRPADRNPNPFVKEMNRVRLRIKRDVLPDFPKSASDLLTILLDFHEIAFKTIDDNSGIVTSAFADVFRDFVEAYSSSDNPLEDIVKLVYERYMKNENYVYDNVVSAFKDALGEEGLNELKKKFEETFYENDTDAMKIRGGLKSIAECRGDLADYIQACSFGGPLGTHDRLDIARRLISRLRGKEAIEWLEPIDVSESHYWYEEKMTLKIKALDLCGDHKEAQEERIKWFNDTLNVDVYNEILKHGNPASVEAWKKTAIERAVEFPRACEAISFLQEVREFELLGKLIIEKIETFDDEDFYYLRSIADKLRENQPLAATLLFRKMLEATLRSEETEYYDYAAKDIATCRSLSFRIADWQGYVNHERYFDRISREHEQKHALWAAFAYALSRQIVEDNYR